MKGIISYKKGDIIKKIKYIFGIYEKEDRKGIMIYKIPFLKIPDVKRFMKRLLKDDVKDIVREKEYKYLDSEFKKYFKIHSYKDYMENNISYIIYKYVKTYGLKKGASVIISSKSKEDIPKKIIDAREYIKRLYIVGENNNLKDYEDMFFNETKIPAVYFKKAPSDVCDILIYIGGDYSISSNAVIDILGTYKGNIKKINFLRKNCDDFSDIKATKEEINDLINDFI